MLLSYQEFIQTYQPMLSAQGIKAQTITKNSSYFTYRNLRGEKFIAKRILSNRSNDTIDKNIQLQYEFQQLFPNRTINLLNYTKKQSGDFLEYIIIMSIADCSLESWLQEKRSNTQIFNVILMILQVLVCLQENDYEHGNINSQNLFWQNNQIKLSDFKSNQQKQQSKDQDDTSRLILYILKKQFKDFEFEQSLQKMHDKGFQLSQSVLSLVDETKSEFNTGLLCYGLFKKYKKFVKEETLERKNKFRSKSQQNDNKRDQYFKQQRMLLKTVTPNKIQNDDGDFKLQNYIKNNPRIVEEEIPELYRRIKGDKYENPIKLNEFTLYQGELNRNHQPHGLGIKLELGRQINEGIFQNGQLLWGRQMSYMNNLLIKYTGYFNNGKREGVGILDYGNRQIYKGYFKNNKPDGMGIMYYSNGQTYEGEFQQGKKHGCGIQTQVDRSRMEGRYLGGNAQGRHKLYSNKGQLIKEMEF